MLAGLLPLALVQPVASLLQCVDQRSAAARAKLLQPFMQLRRGFLSLPEPARLCASGVQHGEAGALAVGLFEGVGEQALRLRECAVAAGAGGGVDYHQPEFCRASAAGAQYQVRAVLRAAVAQGGGPVDAAMRTLLAGAAAAAGELAGSGVGIRAWGRARADAQGFFGQPVSCRRSPMATLWADISPH